MQAATLALRVTSAGSAASPLIVLAVGSDWSEGGVTWNNAPSLKTLNDGTMVNRIGKNYIDWTAGPQPRIAGHIQVPGVPF